MKKLLSLAVLLTALGCNRSDNTPDVVYVDDPAQDPSTIPDDAPTTGPLGSALPGTVSGSEYHRTALYFCEATGVKAYVEFYSDASRKYYVNLQFKGVSESFLASESREAALEYDGAAITASEELSSRVLYGMLEDTKKTLALSEASNFQLRLVGGSEDGKMNLEVSSYDMSSGKESSLGLSPAACGSVSL